MFKYNNCLIDLKNNSLMTLGNSLHDVGGENGLQIITEAMSHGNILLSMPEFFGLDKETVDERFAFECGLKCAYKSRDNVTFDSISSKMELIKETVSNLNKTEYELQDKSKSLNLNNEVQQKKPKSRGDAR